MQCSQCGIDEPIYDSLVDKVDSLEKKMEQMGNINNASDFEKWWLNQCTKGYFIHHYKNDRELMEAVWMAATENQHLRESNATFNDGKLFAYRDAIGIMKYCDETNVDYEDTFDKVLETLEELEEQLADYMKNA